MHYSTAKWLIGILASIVIATTVFVFYSDHKGVTYPLLEALYKPIILIAGVPALLLAIGHVIARGRKEEIISCKSLGRSATVILALTAYRWMTGYFD
ncbi:hypothetical protein M3193_09515 [Sporosarcina luteola]|uniref:hypothetical protein n=1 Tax=Sporosarcina luteola TaxID=582850 RepID=UPI00203F1AF5|nr:hypothetical protein [Sporosarcina luteola]MCM3744380.1 hypothetical protein [Sporosarcina luteola]